MKRQVLSIVIIVFCAMLPIWSSWLLAPAEAVVSGAEYKAEPVLVRVYEDVEALESHWVLMGTRSDDVRLTLLDGDDREILSTTGYADARQDGRVRVRIDKLQLGLVWLPEKEVTFELPAGGLPSRTPENAARLAAEFRAADIVAARRRA